MAGVTADSTLWTADTICKTADGRIICIDADLAEPIHGWATADTTTLYTADNTIWPTADGGALPGASDQLDAVKVAVAAAVVEAALALDTFDAAVIADTTVDNVDAVIVFAVAVAEAANALDQFDAIATAGGAVIDADLAELATALDQLDAAVVSEVVAVPGGGARYRPRRPLPVYGVGYGILPPLWGEAHGVVGVAGKSAAQVLVRAAAVGACGQAGAAAAVLKALAVAGKGAVGTRGTGSGMIVKFSGTATGQQDDDEAAVIAFLLAA